jgi:hypothetical protein
MEENIKYSGKFSSYKFEFKNNYIGLWEMCESHRDDETFSLEGSNSLEMKFLEYEMSRSENLLREEPYVFGSLSLN